ncbi:MAG: nitrate transporter permease [Modestobacter sp.]|jgi:ABC-type nitrate/sulfonate/bicarbonate transport system permease component|nr:nitrate transporter permease [Modestobacter sp.]
MTSAVETVRPEKPGAETGPVSPPAKGIPFYRRTNHRLISVLAVALFLILWEVSGRVGIVSPFFVSSPSGVVTAGIEYFQSGLVWTDMKISGLEFVIGYVLAVVVGIPLGLAMGWYKTLHAALSPFVDFLFSTPRVAFLPLLIVWMGVGIAPKVALVFIMAVLPLLMSVISGVKTVDKTLLSVGKLFGASQLTVFRTIVLPGSVPSIIAGLRVAVGTGLIGMVVGELYASSEGLGYRIVEAGQLFQTDRLFVAAIIVAIAGVLLSGALARLEKRLSAWRS